MPVGLPNSNHFLSELASSFVNEDGQLVDSEEVICLSIVDKL